MPTLQEYLDRLFALVERDHGGCDQNTCDIGIALNHGFDAIAIERWAGSGAACDRFNSLYARMETSFGPEFKTEYHAQINAWDFPSLDCPECNAVIWNPNECGRYCDSCGHQVADPAMAVSL